MAAQHARNSTGSRQTSGDNGGSAQGSAHVICTLGKFQTRVDALLKDIDMIKKPKREMAKATLGSVRRTKVQKLTDINSEVGDLSMREVIRKRGKLEDEIIHVDDVSVLLFSIRGAILRP